MVRGAHETSPGLVIRRAAAADKEAVLAFCQDTWDWGDYIDEVWDHWLSQRDGRLMVGVVEGRPVAVGHVTLAAPGEAWMQGMRVDPAFRGRGIATDFTARVAEVATEELGGRVVRLATAAGNLPIHRIMAKTGFVRVGVFAHYGHEPEAADADFETAEVLGAGDLAEALDFLKRAPAFATMGGLYCSHWVCRELSADQLRPRLVAGEVLGRREDGVLEALALVAGPDEGEEALRVEYADGAGDALAVLARGIAREAAEKNLARVSAHLPFVPAVCRAFESAGYTGGDHNPFWIFAR